MATEYDIEEAFRRIEEELIASMIRNMGRHRREEEKEGKSWAMWQAEELKALEKYKRDNREKFSGEFSKLNKTIEELIRMSNEQGQMEQEKEILEAIKNGFAGARKPSRDIKAKFFRLNRRKLDALVKATTDDMKKAETAVLRMANDQYRKAIFNAQVYANTGAATYEKAVDMAVHDMLQSGLNCVEYSNGARHTLSDYADMALRTANKRAYLQGEGSMRESWGIHTVIINKRSDNPCPKCLPFVGKVMIDDVWSGGSSKDGKYPLISEAVAAGLYHPRCRDSHTTYFPGLDKVPPKETFTEKELQQIEAGEKKEAARQNAERQAEKYDRMARNSLDPENKEKYQAKAEEWKAQLVPERNTVKNDTQNTGEKYKDITEELKANQKKYKPIVLDADRFIDAKGDIYVVDGVNVKLTYTEEELDTGKVLSTAMGQNVKMCPVVSGKISGVSTPDYLVGKNKERWDRKAVTGQSKDAIRNSIKSKKEQADNFVIEISQWKGTFEDIKEQAKRVFSAPNTLFVNAIMIIKENEILLALKRI